tara:strand:+ start:90 stop:227 length:138 start_codon:yes stop_codon:yes gene_type:complete
MFHYFSTLAYEIAKAQISKTQINPEPNMLDKIQDISNNREKNNTD